MLKTYLFSFKMPASEDDMLIHVRTYRSVWLHTKRVCHENISRLPSPTYIACVTDSLNRRYSPSAQRLPKACSDIPQFVYPFLIG